MARKNSNILTIAVIAIILLLLLNAYLLWDKFNNADKLDLAQTELVETQQLKAELESEYYAAMNDLESLRGTNVELNEMIDESKQEIASQKAKIDELIRNGASLKEAKRELRKLKEDAESQLQELVKLREENKQLKAFNETLVIEKENLRENLNRERISKDSLEAIGKIVTAKKEVLEEENTKLSAKVNKAASIEVNNIEVKSYLVQDDGDLKRRRKAGNVDLLEVCFETTVNEIADPGTEQFLVRIISPLGETMAIENMGSGVFTEHENGTQIRYTQSTRMRYDNQPAAGCVQWKPNSGFSEGIYEVEVYNKGFLVGKSTIKLR